MTRALQHGTHVAIIYVGAAYLSVILLELPRLGFRGSLLLLVVPALIVMIESLSGRIRMILGGGRGDSLPVTQ